MPTIERARKVKIGMGVAYHIYFDNLYKCYRVMDMWSKSLVRFNHYQFIEE